MARPAPQRVERIAVVGAGVIGGGWAAHYLRRGYRVQAFDPAPGAEQRLRTLVERAWPFLEQLGLAAGAGLERLSFHSELGAALEGAELVQESTPEQLEPKRASIEEIDSLLDPDIVIASSTSGFGMSELQTRCRHPERCVVAHPFNPPYLIPLVEVVGGRGTEPWAVEWAMAFYAAAGKRPLALSRELPGFVGNRLQEAMWREALHMVAAGEASVEEIDASIAYGPGLRWALMGPILTFHLASGDGGIASMLDHFGPALLEPWTRLDAPPLTAELRDRLVEGCRREAAGRSVAELERERDAFLVGLLSLVEGDGNGR
jgi:carnitine 3-dehydrogenase